MTDDAPDPSAALEMRASDADREQVAERLRDAAGHGRLTMDELEERLELAFAAKTYAELEPLTRDLPAPGTAAPLHTAAAGAVLAKVGGTPTGRRWSIAIMSGSTRRGRWVVPRRYNAFAFWGGVVIDLCDAVFAERETVIRAYAIMGGVDIIAPQDVDVHVEGIGIMGGYDDATSSHVDPPPHGAPIVRVTGIAFWAGVAARRKAAKNQEKSVGKGGRGELTS
ncbi:MAG TPA: DUF1707 domain-containing protein [Actinocrinis sp.]|uniref:DUF1707 SHOCT-like domain-containing protein n=1 Tax=Actinocrinis sp. TaxID=1920516 RepID=UPI002DDCADDF|nr:DUF1707 domain-containing protein [Actinocrinis sp.]HEV2343712.1 DUF1707 domain-containing protein [Actinocrinis sp.]